MKRRNPHVRPPEGIYIFINEVGGGKGLHAQGGPNTGVAGERTGGV